MPTRGDPSDERRRNPAMVSRDGRAGRALAAVGAVLAVAAALAGCVTHRHGPPPPATADVTFERTTAQAVSTMIADHCLAVGWTVDRVDAASVTCTGQITTRQRMLNTLTLRSAARQTQAVSHHFILSGAGHEVRVRTESWFSDSDRGRRREVSRPKAAKMERELTGFLVLMGGRLSRPADAAASQP